MLSCFSPINSFRPHGLCSLPGSPVHGILQARILEWIALPSSRGSSQPRDPTCFCFSYTSCIGRRVCYHYSYLGSPRDLLRLTQLLPSRRPCDRHVHSAVWGLPGTAEIMWSQRDRSPQEAGFGARTVRSRVHGKDLSGRKRTGYEPGILRFGPEPLMFEGPEGLQR